MINLRNIHSLTDFTRNAKDHIQRLKETGQPEVLTVNGKAEVVVQDAASYQKLLDNLEAAESLASIKKAIEQMERGEGRPMRQFMEEFAQKNGIELKLGS